MDENPLHLAIDGLTRSINTIPTISSEGLYDQKFPDELITELHNHLGNVRQLIYASSSAFNAIEQFLILKDAQKELGEVGNRLFAAHQNNMLSDTLYDNLAGQIITLEGLLSDTVDPEYT